MAVNMGLTDQREDHCAALDKSLNLSEPEFLHWLKGKMSTLLPALLSVSAEIIAVNHL